VALLLAACSHGGRGGSASSAGPAAQDLLAQSSTAMADVASAHIALKVDGNLSALPISSAQGDVARGGKAQGSFVLGGTEYPFRLTGGTFYLKPPTGPWVHSPPPYDPTTLLDPSQGVASLLSKATGGQTKGSESVNGTDAYRVQANVPTNLVAGLTELAAGQQTLAATLWIAKGDHRLVRFRIPFRVPNSGSDTVLTGDLTSFNLAFEVQRPA
jgi:lipoprotein LprG